jgi:sialic acid synthase SpsE
MTKITHSSSIEIAGRKIGGNEQPYIIAEMSGNHNGDINRAIQLLEQAHLSGANAVKLQTYRPDTITIDHHGPEFMVHGGLWDGRRLYELYEEAHTPWEWLGPWD